MLSAVHSEPSLMQLPSEPANGESAMPTDVVMPQMGESIFEGTITKWLKRAGDRVEKDEPLFEISTDKVDAEIPSPAAGILTGIKVPEGATVEVDTVVAIIDEADSVASVNLSADSLPAAQGADVQEKGTGFEEKGTGFEEKGTGFSPYMDGKET